MQASFIVRVELPAPIAGMSPAAFSRDFASGLCNDAREWAGFYTDGEARVEVHPLFSGEQAAMLVEALLAGGK
jgi:hypothetical protein